jgi:hypothetical protein
MSLDPERLSSAWAAVAGGVFYGLFNLASLLLQGQPPAPADILRAVVNVICGIVAGALAAYFVVGGIAPLIPFKSLQDPEVVGFFVGALAWVLAPQGFRLVQVFADRKIGEVGK